MTPSDTPPPEVLRRARQYVARAGWPAADTTLELLAGDASSRAFVRVHPPLDISRVLIIHPGPIDAATAPLVTVARLFEGMRIAVPTVLDTDGGLGVIVVSDLGDVTLEAHLRRASAAERTARYEEAVRVISVLQREGNRLASPRHPPYNVAFDVATLSWELEFFVDEFLVGHRGVALSTAARSTLTRAFRALSTTLADEPRVLCHRDFHSRNLMVHAGRLHVIDFQDARMGPATYDLASLLRDSYVDLDPTLVDHLIDHYGRLAGTATSAAFRRRFDRMAVQRNLKALGTFGHQVTVRGNRRYLEGVPRTLRYLSECCTRDPGMFELRDLLAPHLAELRS